MNTLIHNLCLENNQISLTYESLVVVPITPTQHTKMGLQRQLGIYVGFDYPSIIRYLEPLTYDVFTTRFEDYHFNECFPVIRGRKTDSQIMSRNYLKCIYHVSSWYLYNSLGPQTLPTLLKAIAVRKCAYPNLIVHSPKLPRRIQEELMDAANPPIC